MYPYLTYGILVWGNKYESNLCPLLTQGSRVPPCCFPPLPCGFLALITNLVQFQTQTFGENSANTPLRESSKCFCESMLFSVLLLHCSESQSNGLFLTSKHVFPFCMQISFILQCFENLFRYIYFKEKEKYTKGLCNTFFMEETVRTTTRNAKEGDVCRKTSRS